MIVGSSAIAPGDRDPLDHPAAEFRRELLRGVLEPDQPQLRQRDHIDQLGRQCRVLLQRQADVFQHRHRAEQRTTLEGDAEQTQQPFALVRAARSRGCHPR
jgi:hypothetical protein